MHGDPNVRPLVHGELSHSVHWQIIATIVCSQLVLLPAAILFYPEQFSLVTDPFSDLGRATTPNGSPNSVAMVLFDMNLVLTSFLLLRYGCRHRSPSSSVRERAEAVLATTGGLGAFLAIAPHDRFTGIHALGTGLMIGSLWMITNLITIHISQRHRVTPFAVQTLLQTTMLPYALAYARDGAAKQLLQKCAVLGLILAIYLAATVRDHDRVLSTVPPCGTPKRCDRQCSS